MKRVQRSYDDQTKAAVMAALLTGQSISKVAAAYEIPKATVSGWRKNVFKGTRIDPTQKGSDTNLDEMLLAYVSENLRTLREQAIFFRNVDWLKNQDASELAVLHGVTADKTIRLLELFGRNSDAPVEENSAP